MFLYKHSLIHCLFLFYSHIPWYCNIDQELISVRPRGLDPTEMNPALFVYSSTDCTANGVWTRGTQQDFPHANKAIVCLYIVSCIYVVSIKSKPSAILLLNHLRKLFVLSHNVQYKSW